MPGILSVTNLANVTSFANNTSVPVNSVVTREYLHVTLTNHQNNYVVSGMSKQNNIVSIINLNPNNSIVLSGIDSSIVDIGKNIILRNNTGLGMYLANNAYLILLNKTDIDSSNANHFQWTDWSYPAFLMPGEEMKFVYDGTNWKLIGGTRVGSGSSIWDYRENRQDYALGGSGQTQLSGMMELEAYKSVPCRIYEVPAVTNYGYAGGSYGRYFVPGSGPALYTAYFMLSRAGQAGDDYRLTMGFTSTTDPSYNFNHANNNVVRIGLIYDKIDFPSTGFMYVTGNSSSSTANDRVEYANTGMVAQPNMVYRFVTFVPNAFRADFFMANTVGDRSVWHKHRVSMSNSWCIHTGTTASVPGMTIAKKTGSNTANKARVHFNHYAMGGGGSQT